MELAAIVSGGILSLSFLIAVYFWNRKSYRRDSHIEETDGHRVEQNDTIKHYEEKRDKLSKLKKIPDAEIVVPDGILGVLPKLIGAIIAFFVGSQVYKMIMTVVNEICSVSANNATTSMSSTDCAMVSNLTGIMPIAIILGAIIMIFSFLDRLWRN